MTNDCQEIPSQYIKIDIPAKSRSSRLDKSTGKRLAVENEKPNIVFIQDLKKNVGASRYKKINRNRVNTGNRSKKKLKNKNSDTKNIEPGKPKKMRLLTNTIRNSFGHIKLRPLTSVISRVLKRRAIASTSKNELVDRRA